MVNRFLNNRDDNFYSKYLEELQSERLSPGDYLTKAGSSADFVYFIMSGVVRNTTSGRYFESGQMINHDCVYKKQPVKYEYIAETEVSLLKYEASTFQQILNQFPDCQEDIRQIIEDMDQHVINNEFA